MDFNSNAARKLNIAQPQEKPLASQEPVNHFQPVAFSKFEIVLTTFCTLVICAMMVTLVSTKISVNAAQRHYQNVQTKISRVNNSNVSEQQEIDEKTSQSSLKKVAQKYNLKDSNINVRNVNK